MPKHKTTCGVESVKEGSLRGRSEGDKSSEDSGELDLASNDEVRVYKDEGGDEERCSVVNLSEEKMGLVIETEEVSGG